MPASALLLYLVECDGYTCGITSDNKRIAMTTPLNPRGDAGWLSRVQRKTVVRSGQQRGRGGNVVASVSIVMRRVRHLLHLGSCLFRSASVPYSQVVERVCRSFHKRSSLRTYLTYPSLRGSKRLLFENFRKDSGNLPSTL